MKKVQSRASHALNSQEARPAYRRGPTSIQLDHLSVCEMLHDNPNRAVGEAPRLAVSPLALDYKPDANVTVPAEPVSATKGKGLWGFGGRRAKGAAT